jgi:hypothetical protein
MNNSSLEKLRELLSDFLGPHLSEVIDAYSSVDEKNKYFVEIPEHDTVDMGFDNIASIVARTSNVYGRAARFAGMARAQFKILQGDYNRVYKANKIGRNDAEREASAISAAETEYSAMITCESIVHLAEAIEVSARIASESARKLMDKMQSMQLAAYREERGSYSDSDFNTY